MLRSALSRALSISACLMLLILSLPAAQAQSSGKVLAHTYVGMFPTGAETLLSVDPGTGAVTTVGAVPGSGSFAAPFVPLSALDVAGHRYFFPEASSASPYASAVLHELDTQTGAQVAAVTLSTQPVLAALKFDSSSGKLFGHGSVGGAGALLSIDPATGNVTTVGLNSATLTSQPAIAALDPASHRYFFVDYTPTLYVLSTQTGGQIAALSLSTALFPAMPAAMEFDPSSGKLFCHGYVGSFPSGSETLLRIDPATGGVVSVGAWPNSGSLFDQLGMGALDSANHTYFFLDSSSVLQRMNSQTGVAGTGTALSTMLFPSGMEFSPGVSSPPPPSPYTAQIQPPINADGSSVFGTSRGSLPVKFTLTLNGAATCDLPAATISVTSAASGTVDPSVFQQPSDNGTNFGVSSCQYVYSLGVGSLGAGSYEVDITIGGSVVGKGTFQLVSDPPRKRAKNDSRKHHRDNDSFEQGDDERASR